MSKKDDEINRQLIFNSGGANPEDYLTPKQLQRYNENPERFIDIDVDLAMNKEEELKEELERYERQNQEAYDEETKANEELKRRQEEEKKKKGLLDEGSAFRQTAALGTEVGLNTLLDLFSFVPPAQVAGGSLINYFAQRIRGGEISEGEMIASGLASLIPGGAQAKAVLRDTVGKQIVKGVAKGATSGVIETTGITTIDEGRLPTLEELGTGAAAGGAFGGLFTTAATRPQILNIAQRIRKGTGNLIDSLTPGPVRIMQGDLIGQVTGGSFTNPSNKNIREWRYRPPDATQSYKVNQKLLNNAVLEDGVFRTKLYEEGKTDSQWGRMIGINYQTNPNTRVGWEKTKRELRHTWEGLYGAAMKQKGYTTSDIQIEHLFTVQQSMPIYEGVRFGSDLYNQIQARILRRGYDPGNTDRNLMAILPHLHQQKTNYFNALHGKDGRRFFTQDMIDRFAAGDNEFRFDMIDKYLDEVDTGKKILDDALTVYDSLHKGGQMPEELAERLGQIELNDYSAPELKQLFADFEAEGFRTSPKVTEAAEKAEIKAEKQAADVKAKKQKQLDKDDISVEKAGEMLGTFLDKNLDTFDVNPYPGGMKNEDLREFAEEQFKKFKQAELDELPLKLGFDIFSKEQKEKFVNLTMKSILSRIKRDIKKSK